MMEENDLEEWYSDEKEKLSEEYLKKIDTSKNPEEEEDKKKKKEKTKRSKEEMDASRKEAEKEFLLKTNKLREEYQRRYDTIKKRQDKARQGKKTKQKLMKPTMLVFGPIWDVIKWIGRALKKVFFFIFGGIKKVILFIFKEGSYNINNYYTFHLKSKVNPILWPLKKIIRFFARIIRKIVDAISLLIKNIKDYITKVIKDSIAKIIAVLKKIAAFLAKYLKVISEFSKKQTKKLSDFSKKYIMPMFKPIIKLFSSMKKKEEE